MYLIEVFKNVFSGLFHVGPSLWRQYMNGEVFPSALSPLWTVRGYTGHLFSLGKFSRTGIFIYFTLTFIIYKYIPKYLNNVWTNMGFLVKAKVSWLKPIFQG